MSLTAGLLAEHVLWRRYEKSLVQALMVDAGLYAEQGYANNWLGTLSYEHRWRFDPMTEFRYGVLLTRRVYDGSVENTLGINTKCIEVGLRSTKLRVIEQQSRISIFVHIRLGHQK